eukprot:47610-Eustigmatos_ZCMA.PRE.1
MGVRGCLGSGTRAYATTYSAGDDRNVTVKGSCDTDQQRSLSCRRSSPLGPQSLAHPSNVPRWV